MKTIFSPPDRIPVAVGDPAVYALMSSFHEQRHGAVLPIPAMPVVDPAWLRWCATVHEHAAHTPYDPATVSSYAALKAELRDQFTLFVEAGYRLELWPGMGEPYANSAAMHHDVRDHRRLWVYPTGHAVPSDHPLATRGPRPGWCDNDVFRVIHDLVGHACFGYSFSVRGEEAACQAQLVLHSTVAHPALVCEARLQSAWIFFGPHRHAGSTAPLVFPPQKAFAAPAACIHHQDWLTQRRNDSASIG